MSDLFKINVSAVIMKEDNFLLIKRSEAEKVFPGYWGIPGGTVESGDDSLEDALSREFIEEVGIEIDNIEMIANNTVKREHKTMLYIVFSARHKSGEVQALEDTEIAQWKTIEEARKLQLTPNTLEILETCLA